MYYVNKIVGWLLSPLGVLFWGLALGWMLHCWAQRPAAGSTCARWFTRCSRLLIVLALVQCWVLSCGITTRFIGRPLEGDERSVTAEETQGARAIVLLGGGMGSHKICGRAEIFSGADRVWEAAKLFKKIKPQNKDLFLTVSGGGAPGELLFLSDMGVNTNDVVVLEDPRNTEEEARMIWEKIRCNGAHPPPTAAPKILLVTSAWHMPRAKWLFKRVGFEVVPAPADFEIHYCTEYPISFGDFFPNGEALMRNCYIVKEWVARACYALKGLFF